MKGESAKSTAEVLAVLSTDDSGILLEFNAPNLQIIERSENGQPCSDIQLGNDAQFLYKQQNDRPYASLLLGVPASTSYQIEILDQREEIIPTTAGLCTAPGLPIADPGSELPEFPAPAPTPSNPAELNNQPVVAITEQGFIRYQPVIQLNVSPVQFDPLIGQMRVTQQMTVKIAFNYTGITPSSSLGMLEPENEFDPFLQTNLANYNDARQWQTQPTEKICSLWLHRMNPLTTSWS